MNRAKRFKYENEAAPSESSSEDGNNLVVGDENEVLHIEFEGLTPINDDVDGIRQLLSQLFSEKQSPGVDVSDLAKALVCENFVGTVLKQCETDEGSESEEVYAIVSCFSLTRPKDALTASIIKYIQEKCSASSASPAVKKAFTKALGEHTEDCPASSNAIGFIVSERFINVPPQAVKPMYEKLVEEIKEAAAKDHEARFSFNYYVMICKICAGFKALNEAKVTNDFFINAEEEYFNEQAIARFTYSVSGNEEAAKRRVLLLSRDGFLKSVNNLKDL